MVVTTSHRAKQKHLRLRVKEDHYPRGFIEMEQAVPLKYEHAYPIQLPG